MTKAVAAGDAGDRVSQQHDARCLGMHYSGFTPSRVSRVIALVRPGPALEYVGSSSSPKQAQ
jgi:hypothetical protein